MRDCDMFRGFAIGEGDELASVPPHGMVKGRWVYGSYLCTKGVDEVEVHCIWGLDHGPEGKVVAPLTLGRCTGVFDSEDEIVYEGDILKCEDEQAIMCVDWVESDAYFTLHYMYKDGVQNYHKNHCVPLGLFLKTGKRFKVIGNGITPMKQLSVYFPDHEPEPASEARDHAPARNPEIERGRKILQTLDPETQRQLKAFVKKNLVANTGAKPMKEAVRPQVAKVTVGPVGVQQTTSYLVLIECSAYMAANLPLIREHLKKRVSQLMPKKSDLSLVCFGGEEECKTFVERFEISEDSDYAYLSRRIDKCLTPGTGKGNAELFNPLSEIISLAAFHDISPSVILVTGGHISPEDELYVRKTMGDLPYSVSSMTIVGYGNGCDRTLLRDMAREMRARLVYCGNFDSYVPEIEKFLSGGRFSNK
jgi:hypothetical protein